MSTTEIYRITFEVPADKINAVYKIANAAIYEGEKTLNASYHNAGTIGDAKKMVDVANTLKEATRNAVIVKAAENQA